MLFVYTSLLYIYTYRHIMIFYIHKYIRTRRASTCSAVVVMDLGPTDSDAADREDNGADNGAASAPSRKALKRKARAEQRAEWKAAQKASAEIRQMTTGWGWFRGEEGKHLMIEEFDFWRMHCCSGIAAIY